MSCLRGLNVAQVVGWTSINLSTFLFSLYVRRCVCFVFRFANWVQTPFNHPFYSVAKSRALTDASAKQEPITETSLPLAAEDFLESTGGCLPEEEKEL